jgi:hypothetical protein
MLTKFGSQRRGSDDDGENVELGAENEVPFDGAHCAVPGSELVPLQGWVIPCNQLLFVEDLNAAGASGSVYLYRWLGKLVVVKKLVRSVRAAAVNAHRTPDRERTCTDAEIQRSGPHVQQGDGRDAADASP